MVRGVISREANALLGKVENFYRSRCASSQEKDLPTVLRNLAEYLERAENSDILHPVGCRQVVTRFKNSSKRDQIRALQVLGCSNLDIANAANTEARAKLFRSVITSNTLEM
jgi:hypothetical protein